jgi:hypothetical protein
MASTDELQFGAAAVQGLPPRAINTSQDVV